MDADEVLANVERFAAEMRARDETVGMAVRRARSEYVIMDELAEFEVRDGAGNVVTRRHDQYLTPKGVTDAFGVPVRMIGVDPQQAADAADTIGPLADFEE